MKILLSVLALSLLPFVAQAASVGGVSQDVNIQGTTIEAVSGSTVVIGEVGGRYGGDDSQQIKLSNVKIFADGEDIKINSIEDANALGF